MAKKGGKKAAYQASNLAVGQQGQTGTTVYATWTAFSEAQRKNMSGVSVTWKYQVTNSEGKNVWFTGSTESLGASASQSGTYSAPSESLAVQVSVSPVLTKKGNKKATAQAATAQRVFSANAPAKPNAPTVTVEGYSLTLRVQSSDQYAKTAVFYLFRDSESSPFWTSSSITLSGAGVAQQMATLSPGHVYYAKVKLFNGAAASEYSDSAAVSELTIPGQVTGVTASPVSQAQILVSWTAATGAAATNGYELEQATDPKYFGGSNASVSTVNNTSNYVTVEVGNVWYFRVRAKNSSGIYGAWSETASAAAAIKPNPPTTWTLTSTAYVGSSIDLYWTHNSADGSKPTKSQIEWSKNSGSTSVIEITHSLGPDDKDYTFHRAFSLASGWSDGDILKWRVRTQGVAAMGWSNYSVLREVRVYAPASLSLAISSPVTTYPINIGVTVTPASQSIVSFYLAIRARDSYDDEDYMGEMQHVVAGQMIYSRNFTDLSNTDTIRLRPSDINLLTGQTYDVEAIVATNAGMSASATSSFSLDINEPDYYLDMGITVDGDSLSAALIPGCYSDVNEDPDGDYIYDIADIVNGIILDVYRINFDGSFTKIEGNIVNDGRTVISDPHPALDNGKYRVVAIDNTSGAMFFADMISEDLEVKGLVLQWDAKYSNYFVRDIVDEIDGAAIGNMAGGTTLRLPFNVKKNEASDLDVELVDYIGREHPVSYYGTQKGQKSSYSTDVPKDDMETLDLLRRLQTWPGDVYLRAQDGLGYWAKVEVSFDRDYDSLLMPVSIEATRVDSDRP